MPFNSEQLAYGAKAAIDFYLKNDPVDNVNIEHPLLQKLQSKKKEYAGGLQYVVEQIRYSNDSNFQSYWGDQQVTYNQKRTLNQARYTYGSFHDGFGLNEDELVQNGITMTDDKQAVPSDSEKVQLTNLIEENVETLKLGFRDGFDIMIHRSGLADSNSIVGLDAIVSTDPANVDVGGIDSTPNAFWRNYAQTAIAAAGLVDAMETAWRAVIRVGGAAPDFILVGSTFLDTYRAQASNVINRQVFLGGKEGNMRPANLDAGIGEGVRTGLYFKGAELIWDPTFSVLDALEAPAILWEKRCYFLNTNRLNLRPIKGHWMISRRPPRVYDRYVHYFGLTAKAALTTGKRNSHAVLSVA